MTTTITPAPTRRKGNAYAAAAFFVAAVLAGPAGWLAAYEIPRDRWNGWPLLAAAVAVVALLVVLLDSKFIKNRKAEKFVDAVFIIGATIAEIAIYVNTDFGWKNVAWIGIPFVVLVLGTIVSYVSSIGTRR